MDNLAYATDLHNAEDNSALQALKTAKIVEVNDEKLTLDTQFGSIEAKKAVSCILQPQKGDTVLYFYDSPKTSYIIAILERSNKTEQHFLFGEELHLQVHQGVALWQCKDYHVHAESLNFTADKETHTANSFHFCGENWNAVLNQMQTTAKLMRTVADTNYLQLDVSFEKVATMRHETVGEQHIYVDKGYKLDCQQFEIYAENNVKLSAELIMMQ